MFPYFLLMLMPSTFALFNTRRLSLFLWYLTLIVFIIFVGFRFEIGPDWRQYVNIHKSLSYKDFWDVLLQAEPLSYLLFWASETSGFDMYGSNVVAAIITLTGVFSFARRTANPWIAVLAVTPYFIFVMGMSGIRQTMAAGIILFLFSRWEHYNLPTRGVYILVAALFHTSALINNIFLIIKMNIALRYKVALGFVIFVVTLYLSFEVSTYADNIEKYQERYLGNDLGVRSFGSLYHIAMIVFPALLGFIYRRRILGIIHNPSLFNFGLYAALFVLLINFYSPTVASRLTIYLYFLPMMMYPALVVMNGRRAMLGISFAIITFHVLILLSWFTFGNHAFAYTNCRNILFDD